MQKLLFVFVMLMGAFGFSKVKAQIAPSNNGIFFQAVARDNYSNPAKDRTVYVEASIIQNAANGTKVLTELFQTTTDGLGVFSINIGSGNRIGGTLSGFDKIDWANGPYYLGLKIAIKPLSPVTNWDYTKELIDLGASSFGTVPYAYYSAGTAAVKDQVKISDTAAMLLPYAKKTDLALKVNLADSSSIYVTPTQLRAVKFDTTSIYTVLNQKEIVANKSINLTTDATSDIKYPSVRAVKSYVDLQFSNFVLADGSVTTAKIADAAVTDAKIVSVAGSKVSGDIAGNAATATKLATPRTINGVAFDGTTNITIATGSTVSDADANTKGVVQLTGDLTGTATQPRIANGAVTDAKIVSVAGTKVSGDIAGNAATATLAANATKLATPRTINGVAFDGTSNITIATGSNPIDADANTKGIVQLAGDLTGTAAQPRIANGAVTNAKIADIAANKITGAVAVANGGTGATTAAGARTNLGLVIGTDILAQRSFGSAANNSTTDFIAATDKGANNGVATLGNDGKIPSTQIPAISFQSASVVSNQAAMLALTNQQVGSIAIRTDNNKNYVLSSLPATTLANWIELATPSSVTSVNGNAGPNVVLTATDIAGVELASNKSNDVVADAASTTKFPTVKSIKDYVDQQSANAGVADNSITSAKINGTIAIAKGGTGATTAAGARTNLGLVIGTDVMSATATTTLTGDVTGSGNGSFATTVNSVGGVSSSTIATLPTSVNANTTSIIAEITRATNAEAALDTRVISNTTSITANANNISSLTTNVNANTASITAEITRATNVEAALDTRITSNTASITANTNNISSLTTNVNANTASITAEITRATNAEAALDTRITSNTASITTNTNNINSLTTNVNANIASITAEITRATNAEAALDTRVSSNTTSITAEITRATNAEVALDTRVTSNTASITTNTADILLKAPINSPTFTGTPTAPTPATSDNSTKLATTEYVKNSITAASAGLSTIGAISGTSNANGATISGTTELILTPADVTNGGVVTTGAQTFAGAKTFTNTVTFGKDIKVNGMTIGRPANPYASNTQNIAIGNNVLGKYTPTTWATDYNIGIGYSALFNLTNGSDNVAIGSTAMFSLTNGDFNTGVGSDVMSIITTGNNNTVLGSYAGKSISSGSQNTYIGSFTGSGMSGSNNILIGSNKASNNNIGTGITTGSNNTIIGSGLRSLPATLSNNVILADGDGNIRAQHNGTTGWTLGTISSGTWSGTTISAAKGGTGLTSPGALGNILTSDGTGWVSSALPVSGVSTLAYSTTGSSNGGTISGTTLTLAAADASNPGLISNGAQTIAGAKTFSNDVTATNFLGNATTATTAGNITATSNTTLTSLSNLNTVGTITTGTWSGTTIAVANGGTGRTSITDGQILFGNGTSALGSNSNLMWNNTDGSFGIGTSSPGSGFNTKLDVVGNSSFRMNGINRALKFDGYSPSGSLEVSRIYTDATSGTPADFVLGTYPNGHLNQLYLKQSNGFVGIRNSSPASALDVNGTVTATAFSGTLTGNASSATALATGRTISTTGDLTFTSGAFDGTSNVTGSATLTNTTVAAGTYGSSTAIPTFTVDSKGRLTAASTVGITAGVSTLAYSTSSAANGGTISGTTLTLAAADGTNPGLISTGTQTIAGAKTFSNDVTAPNFLGNATTATTAGNITATTNTTLTSLTNLNTVGTITTGTWSGTTIAVANGGTGATTAAAARTNLGLGSLSEKSTIANADVDASAAIAFSKLNITKANITGLGIQEGLTAGSGISISSGTISATGLTTSNLASNAAITNAQLANSSTTLGSTTMSLGGTVTSVAGLTSVTSTGFTGTLSGTATSLATGRTISTTGDLTYTSGAFNGSADVTGVATLASSGVTSGTYGSSTAIPVLTVDAKGRVTTASTVSIVAGVNTVTAIAGTSNTLGATISGTAITLTPADATNGGIITAGTQTIGGAKTFSNTTTFNSDITVKGLTVGRGGNGVSVSNPNTTFGISALSSSSTSGSGGNTAIGNYVLSANTSGSNNTGLGFNALGANVTGRDNTAVGYYALRANNSSSSDNTAIGSNAMYFNTSGTENTAVGSSSLNKNTTGIQNSVLGRYAYFNGEGSYNTAVGYRALMSPNAAGNTGEFNVSMGYYSGYSLSTGSQNVFLGSNAGSNNTTGGKNIMLGSYAGYYFSNSQDATYGINSTGNGSVFIGYDVRPKANNETNQIVISGYTGSGLGAIGQGTGTTTIGNSSTTRAVIYGSSSLSNLPTTATSGNGGDFILEAQDGFASGNTNGGNINLTPGSANGTGTAGVVKVNGQLQITGGSPGAGKVLTSDANGLASWSTAVGSTVVTSTSTYSITLAEAYVFYTGTTAGAFTIPAAAAGNAGKEITIKNKTAFGITITPATGTIYIDNANTGAANVAIGIEASNNWIKLVSDGTQWNVIRALF